MGLEKELKKEMRVTKLRQAVLASLKVGSLLTVAVVAPNVSRILGKKYSRLEGEKTRNALKRLSDKGLVEFKKRRVQLTLRGQLYMDRQLINKKPPKRWDKKWRIVIFDIAESRKAHRNALRDTLKAIGFRLLQRSAWIYPYECEELITLLKADYKLGNEVIYLIADKIENDGKLRRSFGLK